MPRRLTAPVLGTVVVLLVVTACAGHDSDVSRREPPARNSNDVSYDPADLQSLPWPEVKESLRRGGHHTSLQTLGVLAEVNADMPSMKPPIDWQQNDLSNRSFNLDLHSWDMLTAKLHDYERTRSADVLEELVAVAVDWIENNAVSYTNTQDPTFAWYDMAVGVRGCRLAYIFQQAVLRGVGGDAKQRLMWNSIVDHVTYLKNDKNIQFHSNHGVYQAVGQLAMARLLNPISPVFNAVKAQADARLETMLRQQFTSEGVQREHSPGYHWLVYWLFAELRNDGLLNDEHEALLAKAGDAMYWMVKPDGALVNFGDTDELEVPKNRRLYGDESKSLLYYVSNGKHGRRPGAMKVFRDSGFGAVKVGRSYLAQEAAFFSRTHKHADDLTLCWYEGRDVLVDSGKYGFEGRTDPESPEFKAGFWYADPRRQYVEKTRAHNTVEIDGRDFLRNGREPFGSALVDAGRVHGDVYFIRSAVNEFESIRFDRLLIYSPGKWLVVSDHLNDSASANHLYKQWFQFAPDLRVTRTDGDFLIRGVGKRAVRAVSLLDGPTADEPVRGQRTPTLQGWYSGAGKSFVPTTSASFSSSGTDAGFLTLFVFGDRKPSIDFGANTLDHFSWVSGGGRHTIDVRRNKTSTSVVYRSS